MYEFKCESCGQVIQENHPIGKAPSKLSCAGCGGSCERVWSCNFVLVGGGWPGKSSKMKSDMTDRNDRAGRRMRKERSGTAPKLVAHDFGGGDVREV